MSLFILLLFPLFTISPLHSDILVGVDVQTNALSEVLTNPNSLLFLGIIPLTLFLGFGVSKLYDNIKTRKLLCYLSLIIAILFFGVYLVYFFTDTVSYYLSFITALFEANQIFLLIYSILFFLLTIAFYLGGFIFYLYEIHKYFKIKKWKK